MTSSITLNKKWIFQLTAEDTRLVLAALGGRLKDKDIEKAKELSDNLTEQRMKEAEQLFHEMKKHYDTMLAQAQAVTVKS